MRQAPLPTYRLLLVLGFSAALLAAAAYSNADAASRDSVSKPPLDEFHPMVMTRIEGFRWVDAEAHLYLARCVNNRPLCETGMTCLGWIRIATTVQPDGSLRGLRMDSSCPESPLPADVRERLLEWRYNPVIRNGRAVATPAFVTLAFLLGVAS